MGSSTLPLQLVRYEVVIDRDFLNDLVVQSDLMLQEPSDHGDADIQLNLILQHRFNCGYPNGLRCFLNELNNPSLSPLMKLLELLVLHMLCNPVASPRQVLAEDLIEPVISDLESLQDIIPRDTLNGA